MTSELTDRTFAAVLFDNDGTLIDSTQAVLRSWTVWAGEHGLDPRALQGFHGRPAAAIVAEVLPDGDHASALARIMELEQADTAGVVALPGAAKALAATGKRGAIATSATRDLALARLAAAGLGVPAVLVSVDDITHGKPDPEPYLLTASRLGVDPDDCLVVEDAPSGISSARAAGCATLAVLSTTAREDLPADLVVRDLGQVRFSVAEARVRVAEGDGGG